MKSRVLLIVLFLMTGLLAIQAQSLTVTGKVIDNEGLEVIGANVILKSAKGVGTKDLTGSVASVKSSDLLKTPTSDVTQALAGRMAGVQIIQSDGQPGAGMSIRVRGGISITQSNEPLYIIDGFPTEDGMASLDPADIETVDILKDASATAIYGARGANGVVVITTKSGANNQGAATVTFDAYAGVRNLSNRLEVTPPSLFWQITNGHWD